MFCLCTFHANSRIYILCSRTYVAWIRIAAATFHKPTSIICTTPLSYSRSSSCKTENRLAVIFTSISAKTTNAFTPRFVAFAIDSLRAGRISRVCSSQQHYPMFKWALKKQQNAARLIIRRPHFWFQCMARTISNSTWIAQTYANMYGVHYIWAFCIGKAALVLIYIDAPHSNWSFILLTIRYCSS